MLKFVNDIGSYTGEDRPLTSLEIDTNFYETDARILVLEAGGAFGVDSVDYTGSTITFNWSDSTTSGPFFLPVATMFILSDTISDI